MNYHHTLPTLQAGRAPYFLGHRSCTQVSMFEFSVLLASPRLLVGLPRFLSLASPPSPLLHGLALFHRDRPREPGARSRTPA